MTASKKTMLLKVCCLVLALLLAAVAGKSFYDQRHYNETVVVSDALTEVRWLSDYVPMLKGTYGDTPIFVFDSGVPGGKMLYCGGTHPYEPATSLSAYIMMENIKVDKGIVYVIPQCNYSGTTLGVQGNAYPASFEIETEWGKIRECADLYYGVDRNTVNLEHTWWYPEVNEHGHGLELSAVNQLIDRNAQDPISGSSNLRAYQVKIYKATPENSPFGNPVPCDSEGNEIIHDPSDPRLKEWLPTYEGRE